MPQPSKIQDRQEALRWIEEGRTYRWMSREHLRKYRIQVSPSAFSDLRIREGLPRRIARSDDLIPWRVRDVHRWRYPVGMLRLEARRREGRRLTDLEQARLESWRAQLDELGAVVHYDPDTEEGFFYVPREEGDDDLIRRPRGKRTS